MKQEYSERDNEVDEKRRRKRSVGEKESARKIMNERTKERRTPHSVL